MKYVLFTFLFFFCTGTYRSVLASEADSLRYVETRQKYVSDTTLSMVIQTADALAQEGFYSEAIEILSSSVKSTPVKPPVDSASKKSAGKSMVSSGIDYNHLEDVDTTKFTSEEYQDYLRLTQTPMSIWLRYRYNQEFNNKYIKKSVPEVYLTTFRTRLDIPFFFEFGQYFSLKIAPKLEKWFKETSSDSIGNVFSLHSSDMAGVYTQALFNIVSDDKHGTWFIPLSFEWENRHQNRPGYESYLDTKITPSWEYRHNTGIPFTTKIEMEAGYRDFYNKGIDSIKRINGMVQTQMSVRIHSFTVRTSANFLFDTYFNSSDLDNQEQLMISVDGEGDQNLLIVPKMCIKGYLQREIHKTTGVEQGTECTVDPCVRFNVNKSLFIESFISFQRRYAEIKDLYFLWIPAFSFEPQLRAGFTISWLELIGTGGFSRENIENGFEDFETDNRGFKANIDARVFVCNRMTADARIDYLYCHYLDAGSKRNTENLAISTSISIKF